MEEIEEIFKIYNLANIGGTLVFFYTELHGEFLTYFTLRRAAQRALRLFVFSNHTVCHAAKHLLNK